MPQVEQVFYESQEQAYLQFKQDFSNEPPSSTTPSEVEIPDSFQVKLSNAETDFNIVASAVHGTTGVDQSSTTCRSWRSSTSSWTGPGTRW